MLEQCLSTWAKTAGHLPNAFCLLLHLHPLGTVRGSWQDEEGWSPSRGWQDRQAGEQRAFSTAPAAAEILPKSSPSGLAATLTASNSPSHVTLQMLQNTTAEINPVTTYPAVYCFFAKYTNSTVIPKLYGNVYDRSHQTHQSVRQQQNSRAAVPAFGVPALLGSLTAS